MQKLLCPYCDHEIKGKGKCDFCGSRVKKPVVAETSAEFQTQASANPNECDCNVHAPKAHAHDDTYRDSADASYQADYERAYGPDSAQGVAGTAGNAAVGNTTAGKAAAAGTMAGAQAGARPAGAPRRAVLASEAVEQGKKTGTIKPASTTSQKVVKVIVIIFAANLILQLIFAIAGML